MRYRALGSTGVSISAIGFGASTFGNVFNDVPQAQDGHVVREAIESGINIFDVSPYYGLGLAEERLGAALLGVRDRVFLATKAGRYGADDFDFSADTVKYSLERSLQRLKTDRVDLLQVHDLEFGSVDQILHETLHAFAELKQQGKVRFIGITGYWPGLLKRVAEAFRVDTILNYCHSNLFVDDMDRVLTPFADENAVGLINASPLHMGLLGGGPVAPWHPAPEEIRSAAADVNRLCRGRGVEPAVVALHLCLQHPVVATTLIGIASVEQVRTSCAALNWQPDEELLAVVRSRVLPVFNTVWPQGRAENADASLSLQSATASSGANA